ncbi:MAG: antitoxin Xre/MbcA/ParS toxin-binding domain-containing protein [Halomonadaceae bacterium]|uniref:antitoxin Xre/MbcA/ParS toxin-binding domain-containing protein n=1 Tax=unclassified Halomonas TaxID=2609666 RepID=UPI003FD98709
MVIEEESMQPKQKCLEVMPNQAFTAGKNRQTVELDQKLERLSRVAYISMLALDVWEDKDAAIAWLARPNQALNDQIPIVLCEAESGSKQVQRVLLALEWGGSA